MPVEILHVVSLVIGGTLVVVVYTFVKGAVKIIHRSDELDE